MNAFSLLVEYLLLLCITNCDLLHVVLVLCSQASQVTALSDRVRQLEGELARKSEIHFSDLDAIRKVIHASSLITLLHSGEKCCRLKIQSRHVWAGIRG